MPTLLIVNHVPSPACALIAESIRNGAKDPELTETSIIECSPLAPSIPDVLAADGFIFGTPANFGYISGALKHFFDTIYYPAQQHITGRPYGAWIHGNNDLAGASRALQTICNGLQLVPSTPELLVTGEVTKQTRDKAYELGATLAALC